MSCGIGCRQGTDLTFLWLWLRPVARVPIQPLTWDPPYAMDVALKDKNKNKNKEGHYLMIKVSIQEEDIAIINM